MVPDAKLWTSHEHRHIQTHMHSHTRNRHGNINLICWISYNLFCATARSPLPHTHILNFIFKAIPTVSSAVEHQDPKALEKALCSIAASLEKAKEIFKRMRGEYCWQCSFWAHSHMCLVSDTKRCREKRRVR